jgi:hypothetical protein
LLCPAATAGTTSNSNNSTDTCVAFTSRALSACALYRSASPSLFVETLGSPVYEHATHTYSMQRNARVRFTSPCFPCCSMSLVERPVNSMFTLCPSPYLCVYLSASVSHAYKFAHTHTPSCVFFILQARFALLKYCKPKYQKI